MTKKISQCILLAPREVDLLLEYAYPFPDHADLLRASISKDGWHTIRIDSYWISQWIGDLVYSSKKIRSQRLLEELDRLCCALESAEGNEVFGGCVILD